MSYIDDKQFKLFGMHKRPDVKAPAIVVDNAMTAAASQTISELKPNKDYVFTVPLTDLTIEKVEYGTLTSSIVFKSGSTVTTLTFPDDLYWINDILPTIEVNSEYLILVCNGIAIMSKIQTLT